MPEVVSNASPLIALAGIEQLELLRRLFGRVVIPPAVRDEVRDDRTRTALQAADWITTRPVRDTFAVQVLRESLGAGESEAIVLAQELSADWLLLDDRTARRKAEATGLRVIGTLGLLLMGKSAGYLSELKPLLDGLRQTDFYLSTDLYTLILKQAGEGM